MPPVLVIGIGNEYRSDDGVGLVVARELRARNLPSTQIIECSGDGAALMEAWETASRVILIDATASGSKPGTIYRFDASTRSIPTDLSFHSTHAFSVAEAIELARTLDQLPPYLLVYAIERENFSAGVGLSPEVQNAAREVIECVKMSLTKV